MKMPLAYAIATVEKPLILVLDERLSVGYAEWMAKMYADINIFFNAFEIFIFCIA